MKQQYISANWSVPETVHAYCTTRLGGNSESEFAGLNLGDHVGDHIEAVKRNRELLATDLNLPTEPIWLSQVHGKTVIEALPSNRGADADASYSFAQNRVCAVLTADCLPVVFYNPDSEAIAAAHAGWRGLAAGVLLETIDVLGPGRIHAWMGPAIGPSAFEVGDEVCEAFIGLNKDNAKSFQPVTGNANKWLANLYDLARRQMRSVGVTSITGGEYCTFNDTTRFYSYRRDKTTGRMATLIWRTI